MKLTSVVAVLPICLVFMAKLSPVDAADTAGGHASLRAIGNGDYNATVAEDSSTHRGLAGSLDPFAAKWIFDWRDYDLTAVDTEVHLDGSQPLCYVCGVNYTITKDDAELDISDLGMSFANPTCKLVQLGGQMGMISTEVCELLPKWATLRETCGCQPPCPENTKNSMCGIGKAVMYRKKAVELFTRGNGNPFERPCGIIQKECGKSDTNRPDWCPDEENAMDVIREKCGCSTCIAFTTETETEF